MMAMRPIIGHALTFIVSPVVGFIVGKYVDAALGFSVAGGIAGLGGVVLHGYVSQAKADAVVAARTTADNIRAAG